MNNTLFIPNSSLQAAIVAQNIEFIYPKATEKFCLSELHVERGEKVFIHGPSGSGKSTLLGLIAGILKPASGSLNVLGHSFSSLNASSRDKIRGTEIGYIFQQFNLVPYLTVQENLLLPLSFLKTALPDVEKKMKALATSLGVEKILHKKSTEISVGQQQRVAAARAFLLSPKLIIADEPTSSLDFDARESFINTLFAEAEKNNSTVLFVSHDNSLAKLFPKNISLLEVLKKI